MALLLEEYNMRHALDAKMNNRPILSTLVPGALDGLTLAAGCGTAFASLSLSLSLAPPDSWRPVCPLGAQSAFRRSLPVKSGHVDDRRGPHA